MIVILSIISIPLFFFAIWHFLCSILSIIETSKTIGTRESIGIDEFRVALLYTTFNDYNHAAFNSLTNQVKVNYDIFILDDSNDQEVIKQINNSVSSNKNVSIIRRSNRKGFKGGNINDWLFNYPNVHKYDYIFLADADENIFPLFLHKMLTECIAGDYSYVQAVHQGNIESKTFFQRILSPQIVCEWKYQIPAWNILKTQPMLGHGVLIKTDSIIEVGGFPDFISEDLALTIEFLMKNYRGKILTDVVGMEDFPEKYYNYWKRRSRWIQADAQIVIRLLKRVWLSGLSFNKKLFFTIREIRHSTGSLYWFLLIYLCILTFIRLETFPFKVSIYYLMVTPVLFSSAISVFIYQPLKFQERLVYFLTMIFVGASTITIHPIATTIGLRGEINFLSTGSLTKSASKSFTFEILFEILTSIVLIISGILSVNYILVAIGIAIAFAPLLRQYDHKALLIIGTFVFWILVIFQFIYVINIGYLPADNLFALVGIAITLI